MPETRLHKTRAAYDQGATFGVRLTVRQFPHRTELYGGVRRVRADGERLLLYFKATERPLSLSFTHVAEIALDDEPGDWW